MNKETNPSTANSRILVVEDENIVAKDLESRLKNLGYEVVGLVSSGEEAIEETGKMRPDLVLMDIRLKGKVDGIEAAEKIRDDFSTPVVYLTAYADEETLKRAKATEPYGYILKPFEDKELRANIETALYKHEIERKLKESEERYRNLFESANDLIQIVDKQGKFIEVNKKWLEVLGYTKEEVKNLTFWDILRQDQIPKCKGLFQRVCGGKSLNCVETIFVSKNGKEIYVEGNVNAQFKDNKFVACRGIFRDITERKKAEEKLKRAKENLETEVAERTRELQAKVLELEKFNKVAVGRELKMVELKEEIVQLKKQLGEVAEKNKEPLISQEPVTSERQAIPANPGQSPEPAGTLNQKPDSKSTKTLKYKTHD